MARVRAGGSESVTSTSGCGAGSASGTGGSFGSKEVSKMADRMKSALIAETKMMDANYQRMLPL